jgi:hypothetical protein
MRWIFCATQGTSPFQEWELGMTELCTSSFQFSFDADVGRRRKKRYRFSYCVGLSFTATFQFTDSAVAWHCLSNQAPTILRSGSVSYLAAIVPLNRWLLPVYSPNSQISVDTEYIVAWRSLRLNVLALSVPNPSQVSRCTMHPKNPQSHTFSVLDSLHKISLCLQVDSHPQTSKPNLPTVHAYLLV